MKQKNNRTSASAISVCALLSFRALASAQANYYRNTGTDTGTTSATTFTLPTSGSNDLSNDPTITLIEGNRTTNGTITMERPGLVIDGNSVVRAESNGFHLATGVSLAGTCGNDYALRTIPEPSAALLGAWGVLGLLRRRRHNAA